MGMDAKVAIWVGTREEDVDFEEAILPKLPPEIVDGDSLQWFYPETDMAAHTGGIVLDTFECSDSRIGFGIPVFSHDWDFGAVAFDDADITNKIADAKTKLAAFFERQGIQAEIGVWCQTDYR